MNIKEAKKQISNTIKTYLSYDEFNVPLIEIKAQRPIIIMGPPGVGKTEIVSQIAKEMNIGLVSYSLTHHTRQSLLGLPIIVDKEYGKISEYTISEIIADLYEISKETNISKGILFLDEINCVSETLVPTMLQLLQFKKLGQHSLPEGWIIVSAGNPMEYNKNARDFDIVTWDRLKRIDVEPDYSVWKEYMVKKNGHGAIITYLDIKKENFYRYETTIDENKFVTARAWADLSDIIIAYEKQGIEIDLYLIQQYVQFKEIAEDFYHYYCLYKKYEEDYQIDTILNGNYSPIILNRALKATFDERYALLGLILNLLNKKIRLVNEDEEYLRHLLLILKEIKEGKAIDLILKKTNEEIVRNKKLGKLNNKNQKEYERIISFLTNHLNEDFSIIKNDYDLAVVVMKDNANEVIKNINNIFDFIKTVFLEKEEMTIFVTELTINYYTAHFIARHKIDKYYEYAKVLSIEQRNIDLKNEIGESNY